MKIRFDDSSEDEKIVYIEGEINTITTKELEKELDENVSMADDLILDFKDVSYISSAGLRVLIKMNKKLAKLGSFKLRNVNEAVYDVFKTVRFDKILTIDGIETDDKENTSQVTDSSIEEHDLTDEDVTCLPKRVKILHENNKLKAFSASIDGEYAGFVAYEVQESVKRAYIHYVYVKEEYRGKGTASTLINKLQCALEDNDILEIYIVNLACMEGEEFALNLGFEKAKKTNHILIYDKKKVLESPLWKQIEKLRDMFDKVKIFDELDVKEKFEIKQLAEEDFDVIDPLYSRFFVTDDDITSYINAKEIMDNDIWISGIKVVSAHNPNYTPVVLLGSVLDAVVTLLQDDDRIQLADSSEKMVKAFQQVLGEPLETQKDTYFLKKL